MSEKYTVGLDFGTLSVRAVLVNVRNGEESADAEGLYPHGVMTEALPDGTSLPSGFALQEPSDYLSALSEAVHGVLMKSGIAPEQVIGLGMDVTASTFLPVDAAGEPLCHREEFASDPHARIKLWKHHGAVAEAEEIRCLAEELCPELIASCGGLVSPELMLPKVLETCRRSPAVFAAADCMMEMGDWILFRLTGSRKRSANLAGYKAFRREGGFPPAEFLGRLQPELTRYPELLRGELLLPGTCGGVLHEAGAALTGLLPGTPVAAAVIDAHTPVPGLGLTEPGDMIMSIGTSVCHIQVNSEKHFFRGLFGALKDGIIPGLWGYESGQSCCGDHFKWAAEQLTPASYTAEAREQGIGLLQLLTAKAALLRPGQSGLMALDWWNGCRSPLMKSELTGCLFGMTLSTRPEEIFRALIEATAFGTRLILEDYARNGLPVKRLFACGGVSRKNPLLMQIFADVLGMDIRVADSVQCAALGSAVYGAVAAGEERGGWATVQEASARMHGGASVIRRWNRDAHAVYDRLYAEYLRLVELFGRPERSVLTELSAIREESLKG